MAELLFGSHAQQKFALSCLQEASEVSAIRSRFCYRVRIRDTCST